MRKLTLADAVKLKSVLSKRIQELEVEMDLTAFVEIEKGTAMPYQVRTWKKNLRKSAVIFVYLIN
ncbi:hypothetical protein HNP81_000813 [Peribacillus huizhouensis]|uniref:Uncharacterized protein n=1 Tax=Peribacillus huizhouensis TaxID=1501239 RepID=A0ABR6CLV0_9BACI|nr:hypothetical protein [Peribacillus huizhouensis]